ncbi:MAG: quinone oxidoreductase [Alphaproteobacteria bacterium]|nr:quinone oxidoreductase [Alphaproteobacteria bacterium]
MTKAIRFHQTGGSDVLKYEDITLHPPAAGEVRLKHTAIGVNFIDTYHRSGLYPVPLPSGLGKEVAGVVEALGEGISGLKVGDRVATASAPLGMYAQESNVAAKELVKIPAGVSDEVAAAAMLKGLTAWYLLRETYKVRKGETVVVHSAAGGVGLILCQWAKALGASVIGTVGSEAKVAPARQAGAAHVLVLGDGWEKKVREIAPAGVPVVYDSVGKDTFEASLNCLQPRGLMVSFGNSSGAVAPFSPGILAAKGSLYLTRPTLFHYIATRSELERAAAELFAVMQSGAVKIAVNQRFPLAEAKAAHDALEGRKTVGATVLIP